MTDDQIIGVLTARYFWQGAEREDVEQEAHYALERARRSWEPKRASWSSWAWKMVRWHLIECVRREHRRPRFSSLSVDLEAPMNVVDLVEARALLRDVVSTPLSELEKKALGMRLRGEPVPKGRLDNALQRARRKIDAR